MTPHTAADTTAADNAATPRAPSLDAGEIARFEKLAADWWSERGPMRPLHRMNPLRVEWLRQRIARHYGRPAGDADRPPTAADVLAGASLRPLEGLTALDIGCGGGILCEPLARLGARVTGLEPAPSNLAIARTHAEQAGLAIDYRGDSAEALAATGAQFDVVCAMEVVEHVRDMPAFVKAAGAMVKPGGLFFCSTLNRTLKSFALAIVGAEYVLRWVPAGTHQWEKFVTPRELEDAIWDAGLDVIDRSGVVFNPLANQWRLARDMDVNYMMAAERAP